MNQVLKVKRKEPVEKGLYFFTSDAIGRTERVEVTIEALR